MLFFGIKIGFLAYLMSCSSSDDTQFYTLNSLHSPSVNNNLKSDHIQQQIPIVIDSIGIPDSLDRPQLVSIIADGQMEQAEFHRWSGRLTELIQRTIAKNISHLMPNAIVFFIGERKHLPTKFKVLVKIRDLIGKRGDIIRLDVLWIVSDSSKKFAPVHRQGVYKKKLSDASYQQYVLGASELLQEFSRDIVKQIQGFPNLIHQ